MTMYRHQHVHQERHKLQVLVRVLSRRKQIDAGIRAERPIAMLAASVHARIGLLVQQHTEMVTLSYALHDGHHQQVVVVGKIQFLIYSWTEGLYASLTEMDIPTKQLTSQPLISSGQAS